MSQVQSLLESQAAVVLRLARILLPVDFSPRCEGAAHYARILAHRFHSEIVLLHAVPYNTFFYGPAENMAYTNSAEYMEESAAIRAAMLENFLADEFQGLATRRTVLQKDPAHAILDYAMMEHCDLIVMPTHAHSPFHRMLLGSVTARVLHHACCPVLTCPHMETLPSGPPDGFHRILCALELDCEARTVLRWTAAMAHEFEAATAIVHAVPTSTVRLGPLYFDPAWRQQVIENARDRIAYLKAEAGLRGETMIEIGDVHAGVSAAAADWRPDLMVIGRGRATELMGGLRSNTYAILRDAPCPVLAI